MQVLAIACPIDGVLQGHLSSMAVELPYEVDITTRRSRLASPRADCPLYMGVHFVTSDELLHSLVKSGRGDWTLARADYSVVRLRGSLLRMRITGLGASASLVSDANLGRAVSEDSVMSWLRFNRRKRFAPDSSSQEAHGEAPPIEGVAEPQEGEQQEEDEFGLEEMLEEFLGDLPELMDEVCGAAILEEPLDDDGAFPDGDAPPDQDSDVFEGDVPRAAEDMCPPRWP